MTRKRTSLILFVAAVVGVLIVPSFVQARTRTGTDLGSRVAALEAQQATNTAALEAHIADTGNAHDHDARYVRDSGTDLRVVWGGVTSTGVVSHGDGFTATRNGVGSYTVTYTQPFGGRPSFVVDHANSASPVYHTNGFDGAGSFSFTVNDAAGNPVDDGFFFISVGPQ